MNKKELMKYAKLIEEEHGMREKIKKVQNKLNQEKAWGNSLRWTEHHNGVVLGCSLAVIMAIDPEVTPKWHTFETTEGGEKGYFEYGPIHIGEIKPGFNAWIKHTTTSVVTKEAPVKTETVESVVAA